MFSKIAKVGTLIVLLCVATGTTSQAQEKQQLIAYPAKDPLKVWVVLAKPQTAKAGTIELVDNRNRVLYQSFLSKKPQQFIQLFNLSEMTDGEYTLRLLTDAGTVEKTLSIKTPVTQIRERAVTLENTVALVNP